MQSPRFITLTSKLEYHSLPITIWLPIFTYFVYSHTHSGTTKRPTAISPAPVAREDISTPSGWVLRPCERRTFAYRPLRCRMTGGQRSQRIFPARVAGEADSFQHMVSRLSFRIVCLRSPSWVRPRRFKSLGSASICGWHSDFEALNVSNKHKLILSHSKDKALDISNFAFCLFILI